MVDEVLDQNAGPKPTHVFVQGGVGGMAAAVTAHLRARLAEPPRAIVTEPDRASCLLASATYGGPRAVPGPLDTIMVGLAGGEPSHLAFQELERAASAFMAIPDEVVPPAIRLLADLALVIGPERSRPIRSGRIRFCRPRGPGNRLLEPGPGPQFACELGARLLFGTEGAGDLAEYEGLLSGKTPDTAARAVSER